jgi:hypothetical protein
MSDIAIDGIQKGSQIEMTVYQSWSVTDCSYVNSRFKILTQSLKMNKAIYNSGDNMKGQLNLLLLGHRAYVRDVGEMVLRKNWDTVLVFGSFGAIVK